MPAGMIVSQIRRQTRSGVHLLNICVENNLVPQRARITSKSLPACGKKHSVRGTQ
jgi:hypothetical protein